MLSVAGGEIQLALPPPYPTSLADCYSFLYQRHPCRLHLFPDPHVPRRARRARLPPRRVYVRVCDMGTKPISFGMPAELAVGKMTMEVIEEAD